MIRETTARQKGSLRRIIKKKERGETEGERKKDGNRKM